MEAELRALMPHEITVEAFSSDDKYGEPSYATGVTYACLVEQKARQVRTLSGEERVSMTTLYVDTVAAIGLRDRVTLPAGFTPNQPPILAVSRLSDENGLHHTVINL